jgi:hypothetical protein
MAIEVLPLFNGRAAYEYNIVIDSVSYRLVFTWANRHGSWYLDILENDSTPIRTGIRVILDYPLTLRDAANALMFDGMLILQRVDDQTREPTLQDMGNTVELVLVTDEDIPTGLGQTGELQTGGLDRQVIVEAV